MDHHRLAAEYAFARNEGGGFDRVVATLLVTDIVDSTAHALELGDGPWRGLLARHDQAVRAVLDRFRGREVTTTGDGFVAVFDGAERAIHAAQEIGRAASGIGLKVRAGVHSGEIELEGGGNVRGAAIHIATRIADLAEPGQVYTSWATRELLIGGRSRKTGLIWVGHFQHDSVGSPRRWGRNE